MPIPNRRRRIAHAEPLILNSRSVSLRSREDVTRLKSGEPVPGQDDGVIPGYGAVAPKA